MLSLRKAAAVLVLGVFICGGLFGYDDLMDTYFNGDDLNRNIRSYITSVSNLIPDITTLQNVWSYTPNAIGSGWWVGAGLNGSLAFMERSRVSNIISGAEAFGADNIDLANFPDGIPFLPILSLDVRAGARRVDVGLSGMWLDQNTLSEVAGRAFFGEGSSFILRSISFDLRFKVLEEKNFWPSVTVQAGYFFTRLNFGILAEGAGKSESVSVDFRNDSYLIGVQVATENLIPFIKPYGGIKLMLSNTDSEYEWHTIRPVLIGGSPYNGVRYVSASNDGDIKAYGQIYAGLGISIPGLYSHVVTLGGAYTLGTNHFSINAALRFILGG